MGQGKQGQRNMALLSLKMENRATNQGGQAASKTWQRQGVDSPLEPPERNATLLTV